MSEKALSTVIDRDGVHGVVNLSGATGEHGKEPTGRVGVRLPDGGEALVPKHLLVLQPDGHYQVALSFGDFQRIAPAPAAESVTIPVLQERLHVDTREVTTGRVRVTKRVHEREEVVDEPFVTEEVEVKRVPVERWIDAPVGPRQEGDTLIIPLLEEVAVVETRLRLKEEVHITRRRRESHRPRRHVLRSEEAVIEGLAGEEPVADDDTSR